MEPLTTTTKWTFTQKIFFRLFFVYFVLYCFPFPLDMIEWTYPLTKPIYQFQNWWVELSGKYFFHIPVRIYGHIYQRTGDIGYGFVFMFTIALIALVIAGTWTMFADKKVNYDKLHQWLRLYTRFFLAFYLLNYGFMKVFPSQFPDATASTLVQNFGDVTPARLAWNFMGYSGTFMRFTGLAEVLAAILLLFRRTTMLGASVAISVLTAVAMMNFCFMIGAKLLSLHFILIALFLLAGDADRLVRFFILNKTTVAAPEQPLIRHPLGRKILVIIQISLGIWMFYTHISESRASEREYGYKFPQPLLYGLYKTEYFLRNNDTISSIETESFRWKRVVIDEDDNWKQSSILFSNDSSAYFSIKADTVNKMIQIKSARDTAVNYQFKYSEPDTSRILIKGMWKTDTIEVMMKKYDLNNYRLHRTKFKWRMD